MPLLPAFLAFTFITAFTPGPNNILALSTGCAKASGALCPSFSASAPDFCA